MRKFYLFTLALLSAVGLWAQTATLEPSTSKGAPEHVYWIMNGNGILMDSETYMMSNERAGRFAFFEQSTDGDYKIYSIDAQKWISYDNTAIANGENKCVLKDAEGDANAWHITAVTIKGGASGYQLQPYNSSSELQTTYMNWTGGASASKQIGFHNATAANDKGSGWILCSSPTSGDYYLRDSHNGYLNLTSSQAYISANPYRINVTVNTSTYDWKLQGTGTEASKYLGVSSWNAVVNESQSTEEWIVEPTLVNTELCYKLRQESSNTQFHGRLGCSNHTTVGALLYNNTPDGEALVLKMIDSNTASIVNFTYSFSYSGATSTIPTETVTGAIVGTAFPLPTVCPFGTQGSAPSGIVTAESAGQTYTITLTDSNIPFTYFADANSIYKWYYLRMHNNPASYIQYLSGQDYIEVGDGSVSYSEKDSHMWAFVGNPIDGFKVVNKAAGKGMGIKSTGSGNATMGDIADATAFVYSRSSISSDGFCLRYGTSGNYLNADYRNYQLMHWQNPDAGSTFWTEGAVPFEFSTAETKYFYALRSGRNDNSKQWWYQYDNTDGKIALKQYTGADDQLWYFTISEDGYIRLHPKTGGGKAMSYENTTDDPGKIVAKDLATKGWTNTWNFKVATNGAYYGLQTSDGNNYLSNNGGVANKMGMWNSQSDQGSQIYIYDVLPCTLTESNGTKYDVTLTTPVASELALSNLGIPASYISNIVNDGTQLTADVTFPFPVSSVDNIKPTMISAFNARTYKWYADAEANAVKEAKDKVANSSDLATFLWEIYLKQDNVGFKFNIKNFATGEYIKSTSDANSHNANVVTLAETGSDFTIDEANQFKLSTGKYLSFNSSTASDAQLMGTYSTHIGTKNTFPVTSFTAEITEAKAATLYTPVAVNIPANVVAKYPSLQDNNGVLVYETLSDVIPAGSAVVLTGDATTYTFNAAATEGTPLSDNMLFGYATTTAKSAVATQHSSVYALANKDEGVGFYNYVGENYRAGKAYLKVSTTSARSFYSIFDEDNAETGINTIETEEAAPADAPVYDLSGRRVQSAKSGLYIVNGQKVIK